MGSIQRFGSAINCFTVLAGLRLSGETCENSMFVLDGDVYKTQEEHRQRLEKVLTGDHESAKLLRESSLAKIKCLNLPENTKPEKYIHSIIISLEDTGDSERNEIIEIAKQIIAVDNSHNFVDDVIRRLDLSRNIGLSKIVDLISSTHEWTDYVSDINDWLTLKKVLVLETTSQQG